MLINNKVRISKLPIIKSKEKPKFFAYFIKNPPIKVMIMNKSLLLQS